MSSSIPLISLSQPRNQLISSIRTACLTHGFFQITDCPPPPPPSSSSTANGKDGDGDGDGDDDLQSRLLSHMRTFFAQPTDSKLAIAKTDHVRGGYERFQQYSLQASRGKKDLNEGYSIAPEFVEREGSSTDDDDDATKSGRGRGDVWPDESEGNGLRGFRGTCREYYAYIERLARSIAGLIAEGLGLSEDYFAGYFERQMAHCRLIHYYAGEQTGDGNKDDDEAKNDLGAGLHTDWGLITILLQDNIGGLQVLDSKTDTYIPVPPTPGAYVVNCGDLLARFTNGVYTSARHRVIAPPSGVNRYSVPFFCDGNPEYLVDVLPLGEEWKAWVQGRQGKPVEVETRAYEPVKAGKYFEMKWVESAGGDKKKPIEA